MSYKSLDAISAADIAALGLPSEVADQFHQSLSEIVRNYGPATPETWPQISKQLLTPELPFSLHQMMERVASTNVGKLLERRGKEFLGPRYKDPISSFLEFQEFSVSNPEAYWRSILDEMSVSFSVPPQCILREESSHPGGQWLPGAHLNPARNCLSLNGNRTLDDVMIVWRDEGEDKLPLKKMTLDELRTEVWLVAYALESIGLDKGSAIAIDMPMDVNSVVIYLAIVLAGYVVVSIADSFAPNEIAARLRISKAKAIFTQDFIVRGDKSIPLYSRVIDAQPPVAIVIPSRSSSFDTKLRDGDISWHDFLAKVKHFRQELVLYVVYYLLIFVVCYQPLQFYKICRHLRSDAGAKICRHVEFVAVEQPVNAFTNILFSSGTTGEPKAIPWTLATPLKAAADGWCHMDIRKGDIVAWPTNLGWMMGPWLVYASLMNGASMALYNGSPLGSGFAKFVQVVTCSHY
ncbi:hypothetical protein RHMOL_Rhmol12G0170300 [Rhododendron molle]|uniref:Uncharacterized protein n=1 Tax=Rhododendron molle TaxID=49168 RepID=A0ACC0LJC8_RHOML|nr:hypothetical protein RHMOL_Rhmol12G0170300 [Rhododendron molle]